MPKVIITAQVQDPVKWESGFRTHGDLFRTYTHVPVNYTIAGNEVVICMQPENLDTFNKVMQSQATVDAMNQDGVKRDTVRIHVLDKELKLSTGAASGA